jgi:hypothetical protein
MRPKMNKTSCIMITLSVLLIPSAYDAAALPTEEIPTVEIDAQVHTALEALSYAEAWRENNKKDFFIEFVDNTATNHEEIFRLAQHVDKETAAELYEAYVARPDSTKAMILRAATLMRELGEDYAEQAEVLDAVAGCLTQ